MKFNYISPSSLPSQSANSVHVINQCVALTEAGATVTIIARRTIRSKSRFLQEMKDFYGFDVDPKMCRLETIYVPTDKAVNFWIAIYSLYKLFLYNKSEGLLSRNLYAAYILSVIFKKPLIYETHQLEHGYRRHLQKSLLVSGKVKVVTISKSLVKCLEEYHNIKIERATVLPDAAPEGITPVTDLVEKRRRLNRIINSCDNWSMICGYFGHLYSGRGIEIIEKMAIKRRNTLFLICGGNSEDVNNRKNECKVNNILYLGHVSYPEVQKLIPLLDVLLMPYQEKVSIGIAGHDTAKWMSPMKMFEYLASGVPLISSNLPALREVLKHEQNCLLVCPNNEIEWIEALDRLQAYPDLGVEIANNGRKDFLSNYTWRLRADRLLELANT